MGCVSVQPCALELLERFPLYACTYPKGLRERNWGIEKDRMIDSRPRIFPLACTNRPTFYVFVDHIRALAYAIILESWDWRSLQAQGSSGGLFVVYSFSEVAFLVSFSIYFILLSLFFKFLCFQVHENQVGIIQVQFIKQWKIGTIQIYGIKS